MPQQCRTEKLYIHKRPPCVLYSNGVFFYIKDFRFKLNIIRNCMIIFSRMYNYIQHVSVKCYCFGISSIFNNEHIHKNQKN